MAAPSRFDADTRAFTYETKCPLHMPLHIGVAMYYRLVAGGVRPCWEGTVSTPTSPFTESSPPRVSLTNAPLVRVIAQVRFPDVASIENQEFIAPFKEAIQHEYPVLRVEQGGSVVLGPEGVVNARPNSAWRFQEVDGAWNVVLAPGFLALETREYTNRDDFLRRLDMVLLALGEHVAPPVADRVGIRYIDRVSGPNLDDIEALIRPQVAGVLGTTLASFVEHAITEHVFRLPDDVGRITARWGLLPPQATVDPAAIDALDEKSWLLDLDAFRADTQRFDAEGAGHQARRLTQHIYSLFRWVVTDEFLRRYGGKV